MKTISQATEVMLRTVLFKLSMQYGYLATLQLLKDYEDREYYYICHVILGIVEQIDPKRPTSMGWAAIKHTEEIFDKNKILNTFDNHLQEIGIRVKLMREGLESHWSFMRY